MRSSAIEIHNAVYSRDLVKLAFLLKSYENESKGGLDIKSALLAAIERQYWEIVLMLLSAKNAYLSEEFLSMLGKHKKSIFSAENLRDVGLSREVLDDALKSENNIGMLAYTQTGIRKPGISRGSLAIINQKLALTKEHEFIQEDILSKFKLAVAIDNNHRGEAKKSADKFIEELKIWFSQAKNLPISKCKLIYDIMQTVLLLADRGSSREKSKYPVPVPIKINFNSEKVNEKKELGIYKDKHGIHIVALNSTSYLLYEESIKLPLLSIVMHELLHLLLKFINGTMDPLPLKDWANLVKLRQADFIKFKEETPKQFQRLNYFDSGYSDEEFAMEFPPHIIEFFINNFSFPEDTQIFSKKTIAEIHRLFDLFHKDLIKFKNYLLKSHQDLDEEKNPGRFQLFDYLQKGKLDKLSEYLTKDNYRAYNIMPLHLGDIEIIKHFEAHRFPLNLPDKLGVTPLEAAITEKKFQAAVYIMDKLIKSGAILPSSLNVNLQDEQGKNLLIYALETKASDNLIKVLVNMYDAHTNVQDKSGKIAIEYAIENGMSLDIVNLLAGQLSSSNPIMRKVEAYRKPVVPPLPSLSSASFS